MRHQHERGPFFFNQRVQELQKGLGPRGVEACGGLICEEDRRLRDQRSRDRDTLLLALRQGGRAPMVRRSGKFQTIQQSVGSLPHPCVQFKGRVNPVGEEDVVVGVEVIDQRVVLEDPAGGLKAVQSALAFA